MKTIIFMLLFIMYNSKPDNDKLNICFENILNFDIKIECLPVIISYFLSLALITFSFLYKIPQIISIIKSKSIYGINFISVVFELISSIITISYYFKNNINIMNYGENIVIFIETYVILLLFVKYISTYSFKVFVSTLLFSVYIYLFTNDLLPDIFYNFSIVISFCSCNIISIF